MNGVRLYPSLETNYLGNRFERVFGIKLCPDTSEYPYLPEFEFEVSNHYGVETDGPLVELMNLAGSNPRFIDIRRTLEKRKVGCIRRELENYFFIPTDLSTLRKLALNSELGRVVQLKSDYEWIKRMKEGVEGGFCFEFSCDGEVVRSVNLGLTASRVDELIETFQVVGVRATQRFIKDYERRTTKDRHLTRIKTALEKKFLREVNAELGKLL
jgi:hypothetical protein